MTQNIKKNAALIALTLSALAAYGSANAAWPKDQPIRLIVPFATGGTTDVLGRLVAKQLGEKLGQTVIVENKPGAGSMIGSRDVAQARPDGYTLLLGTTSNVLNKYFYKNPLYTLQELTPITHLVDVPNFLAVNKNVPVSTIEELVAYAKANPDKLSCAHSGVGSSPYLSCELFKSLAGVNITSVAYRGGTPAIMDVIGGNAQMFIQSEGLRYIQAGQVKGLGVTTPTRSSFLPDLPPIGDVIEGYKVPAWYGVFGPKDMAPDVKKKLAKTMDEITKSDEFRAALPTLGAEPVGGSPEAFVTFINDQVNYYDRVLPPLGIKPE